MLRENYRKIVILTLIDVILLYCFIYFDLDNQWLRWINLVDLILKTLFGYTFANNVIQVYKQVKLRFFIVYVLFSVVCMLFIMSGNRLISTKLYHEEMIRQEINKRSIRIYNGR